LTQIRISDMPPQVARKKEFTESVYVLLRPGTLGRIALLLSDDEERATFIRDALDRECKRRERAAPRSDPSRTKPKG